MSRVKASHGSKRADWVGRCTKCSMWRTTEHTIINRLTGARFCMFDGHPIHLRCVTCMGGTNSKAENDCSDCGGTGMGRKPQKFAQG